MRTKHRSLISITLLTVVTFGIYPIYWYFITKTEMNTVNGKNYKVPLFLWFFVPIVGFWWFWRFAKALEKTTKGTVNRWAAFLALLFIELMNQVWNYYLFTLNPHTDPLLLSAWGTLLAIVLGLLLIYYYQSNLNKYAK